MEHTTKSWAIGLIFLCTFLTSSAQVFMKLASGSSISLENWHLFVALLLYFIGSFLVVVAYKNGELSVLAPILSSSYIWVTLLSYFYFHETISHWKLLGVFCIVVGVVTIGKNGGASS